MSPVIILKLGSGETLRLREEENRRRSPIIIILTLELANMSPIVELTANMSSIVELCQD